jgi:hypothetical protein
MKIAHFSLNVSHKHRVPDLTVARNGTTIPLMGEPEITGWKFTSGIHPVHGWDVMQVVAVNENTSSGQRRQMASITLARDAERRILRKTDIIEERWEIVTDPGDLKDFREFFWR